MTAVPIAPPRSKAAVAVSAFFRIAKSWKLGRDQCATLLAATTRSIDRWKSGERVELSRDQFERISYILGIYSGLHAILGESPIAETWVLQANADFGDRPPLERMLAGNVGDLLDVRRYVDRWHNGW